jgi:peptidoglycan hydrolase-like protein with peptidoglycan-binding domain
LAALLAMPAPTPEPLRAGVAPSTVSAELVALDDARVVPWAATLVDGPQLPAPRGGMVTSTNCQPDKTIASGQVLATVDARPVATLHTSYPLWRDLARGAEGQDVEALRAELDRLGYDAGSGKGFDARLAEAIRAFWSDRGITDPGAALVLADLVQLPAPEVTLATCAAPGQQVSVGDSLAGGTPRLAKLRLASAPEGLVPGDREVRWESITAPVVDREVTDPVLLAALFDSEQFKQTVTATGHTVDLQYQLANPVDALAVPAAALWGVEASRACLSASGETFQVEIVSSALGNTFVTGFEGTAPSRVDLPASLEDAARQCA